MITVKKFNISKPKQYQGKDGQTKTQWNTIGTMTVFVKDNGTKSMIMEIPAIGLEANIFPIEPKTPGAVTQTTAQQVVTQSITQPPVGEIQVEDIPF